MLFPDRDQFDIEYSDDLMDLIKRLLNKDSSQRINFEQIKSHNFFANINWDSIIAHKVPALIKPVIANDLTKPSPDYEVLEQQKESVKS